MFTGRTARIIAAARMVYATSGLVVNQCYSIFVFPFFSESLSDKHNRSLKNPFLQNAHAYPCSIKCSSSLLCSAEVFWQLRHKTKQGKTMKRPDFKIKRACINFSRAIVSFIEIAKNANLGNALKQNWFYYCMFTMKILPIKAKIVIIMCLIDFISWVAFGRTISDLSVSYWLSWSLET